MVLVKVKVIVIVINNNIIILVYFYEKLFAINNINIIYFN